MTMGRGGSNMKQKMICPGRARGGCDIIRQSKIHGSVVSANRAMEATVALLFYCCVVPFNVNPASTTATTRTQSIGQPLSLYLPTVTTTTPSFHSPCSLPLCHSSPLPHNIHRQPCHSCMHLPPFLLLSAPLLSSFFF